MAAVKDDVPTDGTGRCGETKETVVAAVGISIESEMAALEFGATVVLLRLPCSTVAVTTPAESISVDDDNNNGVLGIAGGGANIISLDVISLNMVCQMTSVILANNTRYSDGKL